MKRNSLSYWILLLTLFALLAACGPQRLNQEIKHHDLNTKFSANVIYGSDGRLDVYQLTDDRLKKLADSTVALVKIADLSTQGTMISLRGQNFGTQMNLCADEKFREQETAAFCSGTLVGPDVVLTAGHCIENLTDCQSTSLVFGFAVKAAGILPKIVNSDEVYRCKEIIKTLRINTGADFALIRLDRSVARHAPLAVRPSGEVESNASLVVIGHPVGLPTKITTGGTVRSLTSLGFFVANLDTYGGNSGSAVFNLATGLIEGVLVRGESDFVQRGSCVISKVCAEGLCRGEDVTRISEVRPFLAASPPPPIDVPFDKFVSSLQVMIPDNNQLGITSLLQVNAIPKGRKVIVSLNIKHTYIGDLIVTLTAADGKIVTLHQRAGGSTDDIVKSFEVTSSLGKVDSTGIYKLTIQDLVPRDVGTLTSWSVEFK